MGAHGDRWNFGRGPISATINTLLDVGWQPQGPTLWKVPHREKFDTSGYDCQDPSTRAEIIHYFTQDFINRAWTQAANHLGGGGLEQGPPDTDVAKHVKRKLISKGLYSQASALDQVVCGGFNILDKCPHCGST